MKQSIEAIASNLRNTRENRNLSPDQLSEVTGVSKSMLRQIETGRSSPVIATIWKIANGLRLSFTALLGKQTIQTEGRSFRGEQFQANCPHEYKCMGKKWLQRSCRSVIFRRGKHVRTHSGR